ncbi:hypothetical protein Tco_0331253, partial [Tanacetum coccineum]
RYVETVTYYSYDYDVKIMSYIMVVAHERVSSYEDEPDEDVYADGWMMAGKNSRNASSKLPARFNLDIRKVDINSLRCLAYDGTIETLQHIFIECHVVVALWKMVSAWWDVDDFPKGIVSCLVLVFVWLRNQCHKGLQAFGWLFGVGLGVAGRVIVPSEGQLFEVCFCVSEESMSKGRLYFAVVVCSHLVGCLGLVSVWQREWYHKGLCILKISSGKPMLSFLKQYLADILRQE